MELKDYQVRVLKEVRGYLENLVAWKQKAEVNPDLEIDFAQKAWEKTLPGRSYTSHVDGLSRPLPNVCLKIPTGGGKTILAVKAIDAINSTYRRTQTGLVLWIVPSSQIYDQTLKALRDRQHPYRQHLDIASAGRTMVIERWDRLTPLDVEENLVVLMLMLPAAARQTNESLRMFRDNGGFAAFFPEDDDRDGHAKLLKQVKNLDTFEKDGFWGAQVKTSLGNTLRLLDPIVVLDEEQRAYGFEAQRFIANTNPSFVLALSATPPETSNVLVNVRGADLEQEEMIKLPLHVYNRAGSNHKRVLAEAVEHRDRLEEEARKLRSSKNVYIRPICLIQVERVGKDQRDGSHIHAEDVKEWLIKKHNIPVEQIAIKTSVTNDLRDVEDTGGLLSEDNQVRYIITKQALQEGWDCPFAYVLAILNDPHSKNALTQLAGRVLRQPYAKKTGSAMLDESYVFCYQQDAGKLLKSIKDGLEGEGLGDLASRVQVSEGAKAIVAGEDVRVSQPRSKFKKAAAGVVLPIFAVKGDKGWRPVSFETDIAPDIRWEEINVAPLCELALTSTEDRLGELVFDIGEEGKLRTEAIRQERARTVSSVEPTYVSRQVLDIIPNPWLAYQFGQRVIECLEAKYDEVIVAENFTFIVDKLRILLHQEGEKRAERLFRAMVKAKKIRFLLIGRNLGVNRLPDRIQMPKSATPLLHEGDAVQKNLFDFVAEDEFNELERNVALYLEGQEKLFFWYRNRVKRDYFIQGWRKEKVFPDFLFTRSERTKKESFDKIHVLETKGNHLVGNDDTNYKKALLELCNAQATEMEVEELPLKLRDRTIHFDLLTEEKWREELNQVFT